MPKLGISYSFFVYSKGFYLIIVTCNLETYSISNLVINFIERDSHSVTPNAEIFPYTT